MEEPKNRSKGDCHLGFKSGFGVKEATFSLQMFIQNRLDQSKDVFIINKLGGNICWMIGPNDKEINIICKLYSIQTSDVFLHFTNDMEEFSIIKGQGCILSQIVFNVYEEVGRKVLSRITCSKQYINY